MLPCKLLSTFVATNNMSEQQSNQALVLFGSDKHKAIDLSLKLNIFYNNNANVKKNSKRIMYTCDEDDREQEDSVRAKKLKKFRFYTMEEEDEERFNGVCTKLKLFDDPWMIKKVLEKSDVNESCRLMISRRLVQQHIVQVWERAGRDGDVTSLNLGNDVGVNVWDCNRGKEYVLTLKMHLSTKCYVFLGNWSRQFVIERGLKKGDEIGLFWCNSSSRFFFSVLALAPHHPLCYLEGF